MEIIKGIDAIAESLSVNVFDALELNKGYHIGLYKQGGVWCANRAALEAWMKENMGVLEQIHREHNQPAGVRFLDKPEVHPQLKKQRLW